MNIYISMLNWTILYSTRNKCNNELIKNNQNRIKNAIKFHSKQNLLKINIDLMKMNILYKIFMQWLVEQWIVWHNN